MKISAEDASHAATLACLALSEEELRRYAAELNTILDHFGKLQEVNTDGLEPFVHMREPHTAFRDDVPSDSLPAGEALRNAPESARACFTVPRILGT